MRGLSRTRDQRGDTIVEVLIATAVITSVLAGAFLVSQKSALAVRDSQEHSEMLQTLQAQVELVRALAVKASDDSSGVFAVSPTFFCINSDPSSPGYGTRIDQPGIGGSLPAVVSDDFSKYAAGCSSLQGRYNVAVTYDKSVSPAVFRFYGRWDRLGGGRDQEQLVYRIYPGAAGP